MSEVIIADTTPLIVLAKTGLLELLQRRFQDITVPEAVYREIMIGQDKAAEIIEKNLSWIHIKEIENKNSMSRFSPALHAGEVEAIILAEELNAGLILLDDEAARKAAVARGFQITGTLGLILFFKQKGWISSVNQVLDSLELAGFYVSKKLRKIILNQAGELK